MYSSGSALKSSTIISLLTSKLLITINQKEGSVITEQIPTSTISEILQQDFMAPADLSAYRLAKELHVPVSRIQDLLHDRRQVTVDTSVRLGRFFGVSDDYFLRLQNDIDLRNAEQNHGQEYAQIRRWQE